MATLSFTQAVDMQLDAYGALERGKLLKESDFTYNIQEKPEIMQDMIYGWRDPFVAQFGIVANMKRGSTSSDLNQWWEAGQSQNAYKGDVTVDGGGTTLTFPAGEEFDIRPNQSLLVGDPTADIIEEVVVTAVDTAAKTATYKSRAAVTAITGAATNLSVIHMSADFKQGSKMGEDSVTHNPVKRTNNPIIIRDVLRYDRSKIKQIVNFSEDMTRYTIDTSGLDKRIDIWTIMGAVFGQKSATGSGAAGVDLNGSESVFESVLDRGNSASGTWTNKDDIDAYTTLLNSVKGAQANMLFLDYASNLALDNAVGTINRYDSSGYNFGAFDQSVDYAKFAFKGFYSGGFDIAYKNFEILSDPSLYGAFAGIAGTPKGLSIPNGQVQTASGATRPYLELCYRDGMTTKKDYSGTYIGSPGDNHYDGIKVTEVVEVTPVTISAKDFCAFT